MKLHYLKLDMSHCKNDSPAVMEAKAKLLVVEYCEAKFNFTTFADSATVLVTTGNQLDLNELAFKMNDDYAIAEQDMGFFEV